MANSLFQLNYDLLDSIAKTFKDEGEDTVKLHSSTHKRVQDLHKEWIGEAAEKFFAEMESELLPALQRLSQALFDSQAVASDIMKIIQKADEETVGYFTTQLAEDDFGAETFGQALDGLQAGGPGTEDLGAKPLEQAPSDPTSAPSTSDAGKQAAESQQHGSEQSEEKSKGEQPQTETSPAGGGGGSSSTPSQGLQGDLKNMGVGLGGQAAPWATAGSGGSVENMPDQIYSSGGSSPSGPSGGESEPVQDNSSDSSGGAPASGSGSIAAAAAGLAGAAAAGKVLKDIKDQEEDE